MSTSAGASSVQATTCAKLSGETQRAGSVDRPPGDGVQPGHGVDEHHPPAGRAQRREERPRELRRPGHVGGEHVLPQRVRRLLDGGDVADAGRMDQRVDPLEAAQRRR
jgi:hypothetical protein